MGLDFSHGDVSFGYFGFHEFRVRLAKTAGYRIVPNPNAVPPELWESDADHPLDALMYHSDCDGEMTPDECLTVAPALEEAVKNWPEYDTDRSRGERLAEAMREAAAANEPLRFR